MCALQRCPQANKAALSLQVLLVSSLQVGLRGLIFISLATFSMKSESKDIVHTCIAPSVEKCK